MFSPSALDLNQTLLTSSISFLVADRGSCSFIFTRIARLPMLELMTWQEIVEQLQTQGQFKMAVMFDLGGKLIASTEGSVMEPGDAAGVIKTMDVNNNTICGLFVSGEKFSCISIDKDSVVGRAYSDVFSAYRTNNMLVCTVCESRKDYSTLGFIKNFMRALNTQEDKTQTLV